MVLDLIVKSRIIMHVSTIEMPGDFYEQTPDGSVLATETVMNVVRTGDLLLDRIGRLLRPLGVSSAGGLVLGLLRDHGQMSPSALGDRLIVTRATVTGLVDSLERRGLVRRTANPDDRRSLILAITPQGLNVLAKVREIVHRQERSWMSALSDTELRKLIALLHRIQQELDQPSGSA
jgi:MarR family 2-MHQ and catechol resistance regulon transcriptional repressor